MLANKQPLLHIPKHIPKLPLPIRALLYRWGGNSFANSGCPTKSGAHCRVIDGNTEGYNACWGKRCSRAWYHLNDNGLISQRRSGFRCRYRRRFKRWFRRWFRRRFRRRFRSRFLRRFRCRFNRRLRCRCSCWFGGRLRGRLYIQVAEYVRIILSLTLVDDKRETETLRDFVFSFCHVPQELQSAHIQ